MLEVMRGSCLQDLRFIIEAMVTIFCSGSAGADSHVL
jgi:hypothetical protein